MQLWVHITLKILKLQCFIQTGLYLLDINHNSQVRFGAHLLHNVELDIIQTVTKT